VRVTTCLAEVTVSSSIIVARRVHFLTWLPPLASFLFVLLFVRLLGCLCWPLQLPLMFPKLFLLCTFPAFLVFAPFRCVFCCA
jgi:hypothetical protein